MAAKSKESTYNCKYFPSYNLVLICTLHGLVKTSAGYKQACNSTAGYKHACNSTAGYKQACNSTAGYKQACNSTAGYK